MIDTIFIGTSGLTGFSKGLKVISNNVANLNTPGFKSSSVQFADLYYQSDFGAPPNRASSQTGTGLTTLGTSVSFKDGDTRQTGNPLDMSLDGPGFFVLRDPKDGALSYSRAGQFEFNEDAVLVTRGTAQEVMGYAKSGEVGTVPLSGLRVSAPQATGKVSFAGNLSSTATSFSIAAVNIIDSGGAPRTLNLDFTRSAAAAPWTVAVAADGNSIGTGTLEFSAATGQPISTANSITIAYTPSGTANTSNITLDFSGDVTSFAGGTSTLAVAKSDGFAAGQLTQASFDEQGVLTLSYSNGQTATGAQLQLALFDNTSGLQQDAAGQFISTDPESLQLGRPGSQGFAKVASSQIEGSNVDLSAEFSDLIVMQRGYQASSRIVTTANEMLQELFDLKRAR